MAGLLQNELKAIRAHPLRKGLETFRTTFKSRYLESEDVNLIEIVDQLTSEASNTGGKDVILDFILALQAQPAARTIRSRTGNGPLIGDISSLIVQITSNTLNIEYIAPLMKLVLIKAEDVEIWTAMLDFIARTRPILQPTTPPTSVPASFDGTPITHSSASQQGGEQTRKLVERRIFEEIKNCTYRNVGGFFSKYFEGKDWTEQTKKIYRAVQGQKAGGRWTEFPDPPVQDAVVEWLFHFQEEFLSDAGGVYYTSESSKDLTGAEARRQLDIFIKRKSNASGTVHNWKDVRVIGEHKTSNSKDFKPLLLQLGQTRANA